LTLHFFVFRRACSWKHAERETTNLAVVNDAKCRNELHVLANRSANGRVEQAAHILRIGLDALGGCGREDLGIKLGRARRLMSLIFECIRGTECSPERCEMRRRNLTS